MNNLQKIIQSLQTNVTKNSPTIFTGLAVAGVVTTTVLAVKATPKALDILEERKQEELEINEDFDSFTAKEIIRETWKCYIPAAAMGAVTIVCVIGANTINTRRNAALASVYSISETALKEYQAKVSETIGKNKNQKIKDDLAKERIEKNPVNKEMIITTGYGNTLCYDSMSGRYFRSDIEKIKQSFNKIGRDSLVDMFTSLNDIYYELGLSSIKIGNLIGWHVEDGLVEPTFSSQLTEDGEPCLVMDYSLEPRYGRSE